MTLKRAAPWIASLAAHAVLVLFVPLSADLRGMRVPAPERRVVLEFDDADHLPSDPASSSPPAPSIGPSDLTLPAGLPLPTTSALDPVTDAPAPARVVTVAGGVPSPREVLASLPAASAPTATTVARADAAASEPTMRTEWSGKPREPIREGKLRFPEILSATGLVAEGAARITVSPLGAVVDVEIIRSSGYTEIDAAVETALRQNIYPRVEGKLNQIGTVYYSFPLERRD